MNNPFRTKISITYMERIARLASLRELKSAMGEELSALLPSVLDRAFKGELRYLSMDTVGFGWRNKIVRRENTAYLY